MKLYPVPQLMTQGRRVWDYSDRRWLIVPAQAEFRLKEAALRTAQAIAPHFVRPVQVTAGLPGAGQALAQLHYDDTVPPQGFTLAATAAGFQVRASDNAGWYYALLAIEQLLSDGAARIPELSIDDAPDLHFRGYMLDVSRCKVPTMATAKAIIDNLSRLRYNELQLYMEHTFAFAGDERVWFDSSPFSAAEILELDAYCHSRFVELVPNLNSFGHLERWLRFAEYRHLAESAEPWYFADWDVHCQAVLAPGAAALEFIDRLYAEFLPNFTSKRINIGGDETLELGQGRSKAACAERGVTRVYLDFLLELAKVAKRHGRSVQFWGDIIMHNPELIQELPQDITALEWGYEADHPFEADTAKFQAAKVPFYVCPGTSSWNSFSGRTRNMLGNIENAARNGKKTGAVGLLMTDWGDGGHIHYWPLSWPGLAYAAGCAWNAAADSQSGLPQAINFGFCPESQDPRLGELLLALGRIPEAFAKQFHNSTAYFITLMRPDWKQTAKYVDGVTVEEIRAARRQLANWRRSFTRRPPTAPRLVLDELRNTANLIDLALLRLLKLKGGTVPAKAWNDAMRHVIGNHNDLWLSRNRPGGLHESSENLRNTLVK